MRYFARKFSWSVASDHPMGRLVRAAGYFRVSTDRQAEGERQSLPAQREAFLARCKERGFTAQTEYIEAESGRKVERSAYQRMLADARRDAFDVIVVTYLDRFGRDQWEVVTALGELRRLGVSVDAIFEDTSEFLMVALSAWKAEQESRRIGERVKLTMARAASQGIWQGGPAPYGYRVQDKRLVVDSVEAEVVRGIYRDYVEQNRSILQITRSLNAAEAPTRTGAGWSQATVSIILRRRLYTGASTWAGAVVEGQHPAIISRETYEDARARAAIKRTLPAGRTHVSDYLLAGLVYCGHCGGRMQGHKSRDRHGDVLRAYVCSRHRKAGSCVLNWTHADRLEARVVDVLTELADDWQKRQERIEDEVGRLRGVLAGVEDRIAAIPADLDKTFDAYRRSLFASDEQFQRASRSLVDEQHRLEAERRRLTDDIERAALSISALTLPVGSSPAQRKAHFQQAIERVICVSGEPASIRIRA